MSGKDYKPRKRLIAPGADMHVSDMGKIPPQAIDLEEAVLGAIMLEKEAFNAIADLLNPEAFYKEQNGRICTAIMALANRGEPFDIITVTQELKRTGELEFVGGAYYVSKLSDRIASSANIEYHMRIVQQKYLMREIIRTCTARIREAYEESADSFDVLDDLEKDLIEITNGLHISKMEDGAGLIERVLEENRVMRSKKGTMLGVPTGLNDLDQVTGGWQNTDLIVLAARPGMGKTALMLNFATYAVKQEMAVAIFSLEMSALQLMKRMCSQETDIPLEMILRQGMDDDTIKARFTPYMGALKKGSMFIDDTGGLTLAQLRRKARKMKREKKIRMIIIDYLQLMAGEPGDGNRENEVSKISRGIKALAKELEIPIIALSQLSRQTENRSMRADHLPKLSDLRDSGAIEQDADMVMFIYRPEYYGITEVDNEPTAGRAQIIIAKNRHGATQNVELRWIGECVKFINKHPNRIENNLQPNTEFLP